MEGDKGEDARREHRKTSDSRKEGRSRWVAEMNEYRIRQRETRVEKEEEDKERQRTK
jgi:hypothetical protein